MGGKMIRIDWHRKFLDVGRYRYRFLKIDMEPWRDRTCPICEQEFTSEPRFYFMSHAIHWETCAEGEKYEEWLQQFYDSVDQSELTEIDPTLAAEYAYAEAWKETELQNDWY